MTDSVSIDAIGSGLKEWATEETAREIATALAKITKNSDRMVSLLTQKVKETGKTGSKSSVRSIEDELDRESKGRKKNTEQTELNNRELAKKQKALKKTTSSLGDFSRDLLSATKGILGTMYASITGGIDAQIDIYRSGASFGSSLSGNLSSLANTMRVANLTFGDLQKITAEYGATLAREGTGAFTRYSASLRKSFVSLGMTSQASAEWIAEYLKGQEKYAYRQNLSEYQQTRMMRRRASEMEEWSRVLGISQAQILKSINAEKEKPNVAAFLATLGPESEEAFAQAMQVVADSPELKGKLSDALADPFIARSQLFTDLVSQGASESAEILSQIHTAIQNSPKDVPMLMDRFTRSLADLDLGQARVMGEAGRATMAYVGEANRIVKAMQTQGGELRKGVDDLVDFKDAQTMVKVAMQGIALEMNQLIPVITKVISTFADLINYLNDNVLTPLMETQAIKDFVQFFRDLDIKKVSENVSNFVGGLSDPKVVWYVAGGIAALFLAPTLIKAVASTITGTLGKAMDAVLGSGGKTAGRGAASGMKGIAAGLSFFANPKVLLGGITLGAVIAAIGAGIAAATWLTGKSLNTFAEGMTHMQALDGERLSEVGRGIGDLSIGLLQFAGAKAAETLSGLFSTFTGLFRSKDSNPLVALQQFADASGRLSKPLTVLGEALTVFAPNFKMIAEAFSYDFNFDFKKFREALIFLSGGEGKRKGLDPDLLGKVAQNMERMTNASGRLHVATHATSKFAEALMQLATAMRDIKNIGDVDLAKQLRFDENAFKVVPSHDYVNSTRASVQQVSNGIPSRVAAPTTPGKLSEILPSVKRDPAVSTPSNFVEMIETATVAETAAPSVVADAEIAKAERMYEDVTGNSADTNMKMAQLIEISRMQLDMLSRIRKSITDRGI